MTSRRSTPLEALRRANPVTPNEFAGSWADPVGQTTLDRVLGSTGHDEHALAADLDVVDLALVSRHAARRRRTVGWVASAAVLICVLAVGSLAALGGEDAPRPPATAVTPGPTHPRVSSSPVTNPTTAPARPPTNSARATRQCTADVRATIRAMISAYTAEPVQSHKQAAALRVLAARHPRDTLLWQRDHAAFADWIARGAHPGRKQLDSVVGRACVQ